MNTNAKGARGEREFRGIKEIEGYLVVRAGGSLGPFDLIGVRKDGGFLAQVKNGYEISDKDKEKIREFKNYPTNFIKLAASRLRGGKWEVEIIP